MGALVALAGALGAQMAAEIEIGALEQQGKPGPWAANAERHRSY